MRTLILLFLTVFSVSCFEPEVETLEPTTFKIAFGSCAHQDHPLPIFNEVLNHHPDLFIFLGDNIYGDTYNLDTLRSKYSKLEVKPSFQALKNAVPILAVWDDHDYGWNDAGKEYRFKESSKEIFLDFWDEPEDSDRRKHPGVYHAKYFEFDDQMIQIIMLDTRTFRDGLKAYDGEVDDDVRYFYKMAFGRHQTTDSTILGDEQWKWLEAELEKEADVRIICSSIQFNKEFNGYEAWANFPHEQKKG